LSLTEIAGQRTHVLQKLAILAAFSRGPVELQEADGELSGREETGDLGEKRGRGDRAGRGSGEKEREEEQDCFHVPIDGGEGKATGAEL